MNMILKHFSQKRTAIIALCAIAPIFIFHLLVLVQVIPYTEAWGGQFESYQQAMQYELISITMNTVLILTILSTANIIKTNKKKTIATLALLFALATSYNAVDNIFFKSGISERTLGVLAFVLAVSLMRLGVGTLKRK